MSRITHMVSRAFPLYANPIKHDDVATACEVQLHMAEVRLSEAGTLVSLWPKDP